MNFKRTLIAILFALVVTTGLFALMVALIESGDKEVKEAPPTNLADILMPDREISDNTKDSKPKKPEQDEPPPDIPQPEMDDVPMDDVVNIASPNMGADLDIGLDGVSASDGEYLPIVKVAPQYPRRAAAKGIEGYVILEFTVTKLGTFTNPVVIEADPPGYFDSAATKAVMRFKYKPTIINGEAIDVPGVKNKITFKLAEK